MLKKINELCTSISEQEVRDKNDYEERLTNAVADLIKNKLQKPIPPENMETLKYFLFSDKRKEFLREAHLTRDFSTLKLLLGVSPKTEVIDYICDSTFFQNEESKEQLKILRDNQEQYCRVIFHVSKNNDKYVLDTREGQITYYQASDKYFKDYPGMFYLLSSDERYNNGFGRCHELSYFCAKYLYAEIVTGFVSSADTNILHSFILKDGFVIDPAHNFVMNEHDYYELNQVDELVRFSADTVQTMPETMGDIYTPVYFALLNKLEREKILQKKVK